ncbi:putative regulatory protein, FmdB family [Terriglobus roseus DSM 18391]|uniref:Putative regulatory protein, FmdB family n=1 Tax=Terriglobus roseus (strain DSM 18391 / NRRL B-41598 / KBS 63) TaxID=926566 RepID=I3ZLN2_TERRK|nr:zinc ribbon domain-containing protein [Terriglobus roseus]AFL90150.1 putative regulatory protein, FmdB family [Terriglobus roseus DSM 18391]
MPIYEYKCNDCGRALEKRQKFSDPELTECPHCGGRLEKQISAPSFQFSGGGWYADGYGNKAAAKSTSGEGSSASGDSKPASTSSPDSSSSTSTPAAAPSAPSAPASTSTPAK